MAYKRNIIWIKNSISYDGKPSTVMNFASSFAIFASKFCANWTDFWVIRRRCYAVIDEWSFCAHYVSQVGPLRYLRQYFTKMIALERFFLVFSGIFFDQININLDIQPHKINRWFCEVANEDEMRWSLNKFVTSQISWKLNLAINLKVADENKQINIVRMPETFCV